LPCPLHAVQGPYMSSPPSLLEKVILFAGDMSRLISRTANQVIFTRNAVPQDLRLSPLFSANHHPLLLFSVIFPAGLRGGQVTLVCPALSRAFKCEWFFSLLCRCTGSPPRSPLMGFIPHPLFFPPFSFVGGGGGAIRHELPAL